MAEEKTGQQKANQRDLPEATLTSLGQILFSQALLSMGGAKEAGGQKDLPVARFHIDLLEMLEAKTKGNRTDEENQTLEEMLHALRMAFLEASRQKA